MEQLPELYVPTLKLLNRERRRRFINEAKHIEEYLGAVEVRFYTSLFVVDDPVTSYHDVYVFYLDQFYHNLTAYYLNHTPRITKINERYFYEMFHPVEDDRNSVTLKECCMEIVGYVKSIWKRRGANGSLRRP